MVAAILLFAVTVVPVVLVIRFPPGNDGSNRGGEGIRSVRGKAKLARNESAAHIKKDTEVVIQNGLTGNTGFNQTIVVVDPYEQPPGDTHQTTSNHDQAMEKSPDAHHSEDILNSSQRPEHDLPQSHHVTRAIPNILIFTHYKQLLDADTDSLNDEERVLAANIRNSIQKHEHRNPEVRFLTDDDCIQSLSVVFPDLIPYFQNEKQGMYKADICRGSALYETGGIYLDVDVGVRKDLWHVLLPQTEFVTVRVHSQSSYPGHFFQAVLGVTAKNPIIYKYLQLFYDHYVGKEVIFKGPLGVLLLRRAWDHIYDSKSNQPPTELWQEVLYSKQLFPKLHPAPTWGGRKRACHFVVVARAHSGSTTEFTHQKVKYHIPVYSRIGGSRMCPLETDTNHKGK